jgi:hypothetical protein
MEIFTVTTKLLMNEPITDEELEFYRNYCEKYTLVCKIVMEELNKDSSKSTSNFRFTPGEDFMKTPTVDVVNSILKMFSGFLEKNDPSKPFGESPQSGRLKKSLMLINS